MFAWLQRLLAPAPRPPHPLDVPLPPPRQPGLSVRLYTPADFDACLAIHDLNSPGRFPAESSADFRNFLTEQSGGYCVVEHDGRIVGCAGYVLHNTDFAHLVYGLVHPDWQNRGIGRILLLLRISQLKTTPERRVLLTLCAVEDSMPYYAKHGFKLFGDRWIDAQGCKNPWGYVVLNVSRIQRARDYLVEHAIQAPDLASIIAPPSKPLRNVT